MAARTELRTVARGDVKDDDCSVTDDFSSASEASTSLDFTPLSVPNVLSADATFFFFDFLVLVGAGDPSPSLRADRFGDLLFFDFDF